MNFRSSILFAFRVLLPKNAAVSNARKSMAGAVVCIALSLVPLIVVSVVSNSMIEGITERIIGLSSYHLQAVRSNYFLSDEKDFEDIELCRSALLNTEGVRAAYIEKQGMVLAAGKNGRTGAAVRAVDPDIFVSDAAFCSLISVAAGSADISRPKTALIGEKLSEILQLTAGDTLRLISVLPGKSGKPIPKISRFTVSGVISCGYQELDALWVFIPLDDASSVFARESARTIIGIETASPFSDEFQAVYRNAENALPDNYQLYRWQDLNASQFENFSSTKTLLLLIMSLIVLVASVNVSSALVMLIMERSKEIAILKSIGASGSGIAVSFLCVGTCIGVLGVLLGMPLGLVCSVNINEIITFAEKTVNFFMLFGYSIVRKEGFTAVKLMDPGYYLEKIPVAIPFGELLAISTLTLVLSLCVSVVPAIRAGKEKPLSILRKV
ncbi:MAG: ABC transporter permease [Bacteroides sp.]|nr:ABC transporter permease [Prevotella sp.]MCM1407394.1 ABC transporter permease [Treponema brennaborense]MCM1469884.1 ABC transporter permease [Bacteroides sp.]